jgi:hypothetical protein
MPLVRFGSARIAVMVALIGGGIFLLATGFPGNAGLAPAAADGSHSPSPTPTSAAHNSQSPTPPPQTTGVPIAVFNATTTSGAAKQAQDKLVSDGYLAVQPASDSPVKPFAKTVVYYRSGLKAIQNRADAQYLADQYFQGAEVQSLGDAFVNLARGAEVVIVLGNNYTSTSG